MEQIRFAEDILQAASEIREQILQALSVPVYKEGCNTKHEASKRCQALATFMETLMEEMNRDELKLEMPHDADMAISERDSVMLGEISPHHEYYDSKSSSETPPSYNQLNYSENLSRFFESKPEDAIKIDNNTEASTGPADESSGSGGSGSIAVVAAPDTPTDKNDRKSESPQQRFGSSGTGSAGNCSSGSNLNMGSTTNTSNTGTSSGSYQPPALTEALLNRHNDDMEKLLLKRHRDFRATSRNEKTKKNLEVVSKQQQQSQQLLQMQQCQLQVPTSSNAAPDAGLSTTLLAHGTKRSGSHSWEGLETYHRTSKHQHVNEDNGNMVPSVLDGNNLRPATNLLSVPPANQLHNAAVASAARSPFTQQAASSLIRNLELWPPFSASLTSLRTTSVGVPANPYQANPGQMYRTMYYIPPQQQPSHGSEHPGPPPPQAPAAPAAFQYMTGIMLPHAPLFGQQFLYHPMYYQPMVPMATDQQQQQQQRPQHQPQPMQDTLRNRSSDEMEESSYSSLYSSFLRTESSSNEETDRRRPELMVIERPKKIWRRPEPPWLDNITVTSDLIYRYQKTSKTLSDVLEADLTTLKLFTQPGLVNDQLNQLYLDMELEGLSAKLCLSEKNFSCSSEDEDMGAGVGKRLPHANHVMIYEENAPLPPIPVPVERFDD